MVDKPADTPRPLLPTDLDAQDYVTVWDHGPKANTRPDKQRTEHPVTHGGIGGLPPGDATPKETESDEEWYRQNGEGPVAMRMPATDAKQAMENDPLRYRLEPRVDESAVAAKVKEIQERRKAAEKAAEDHDAAIQLALDRKEAISAVMLDRTAAAADKKADDLKERRDHPVSDKHHPSVYGRPNPTPKKT